MRWKARPTGGTAHVRDGADAGFTLAEVLAALLFMAIVIPVAVQGLRVASLAGTVAQRKTEAARVAERVLNESIVTTNWSKSVQNGTAFEGTREYRWTLQSQPWGEGQLQLISAEVIYLVQNRDYQVRLSTLVDSAQP